MHKTATTTPNRQSSGQNCHECPDWETFIDYLHWCWTMNSHPWSAHKSLTDYVTLHSGGKTMLVTMSWDNVKCFVETWSRFYLSFLCYLHGPPHYHWRKINWAVTIFSLTESHTDCYPVHWIRSHCQWFHIYSFMVCPGISHGTGVNLTSI